MILIKIAFKIFFIVMLSLCIVYISQLSSIYLKLYLQTKYDRSAIYLWGDSRAHQGIDTKILGNCLKKDVYSFTKHGNSLYNFLVFTERVPKESVILVGSSEAMFIRNPEQDNYHSSLSLQAVQIFISVKYPFKYITRIISENLGSFLYTDLNTVSQCYPEVTAPAEKEFGGYCNAYSSPLSLEYSKIRMKIFNYGLNRLVAKGCRVVVIDMPISDKLKKMRDKSVYNNYLSGMLSADSVALYANSDVISDKNIFYDVSHLSCSGRQIFTKYLCGIMANHL